MKHSITLHISVNPSFNKYHNQCKYVFDSFNSFKNIFYFIISVVIEKELVWSAMNNNFILSVVSFEKNTFFPRRNYFVEPRGGSIFRTDPVFC